MIKLFKLLKNVKGATAIEYGLIAALIAVAAIGAMQGIGNKLNTIKRKKRQDREKCSHKK